MSLLPTVVGRLRVGIHFMIYIYQTQITYVKREKIAGRFRAGRS